jgi:diguanylate cyclase (GGDEF)-like protein
MRSFKTAAAVCLILFFVNAFAGAYEVLFISSYSESFETIDRQKKGLHEVFDPAGVSIDIEYMDMKNYNTDENVRLFQNLLTYKLSHHGKYDAVIAGDDAALKLVSDTRELLFGNTPIVFFCINNVDDAEKAGNTPYMTGAIEESYMKETIETAARFQPGAKNIVCIVDNTLTGKGDCQQFFSLRNLFPEYTLSVINTSECTYDEFCSRLERLGKDTILLYMTAFEDSDGNQYTVHESVKTITQHAHIPVYRCSFGGVGEGLIGGKMVSYEASGRQAARMVMDILNGKNPSDMPVIFEGEGNYCFDCRVLKKYDIPLSLVPGNAVLINNKVSFFDKNKKLLLPVIVILLLTTAALSFAVYDNMRNRHFAELFRYQAEHDYLTGLLTRRAIKERLSEITDQKKPVCVMLLDIDDFKRINDADGHANGDTVLSEIALRLISIMEREHLHISRFGGDEFMILSLDVDREYVAHLVTEIQNIFAEPVTHAAKKYFIKGSIGIAFTENDDQPSSDIIANADLAMYTVKKSGKNGFAYYDAQMKSEFIRKKVIETSLTDACLNSGFYAVFQPQVETAGGKIHCCEALVRMTNSDLSPAQFIPVAEDSDIVIRIGRIMTHFVIAQIAKWRDDGIKPFPVSINYSNKQLRDRDYAAYLKGLLDLYDIPPELVEIEITESVFIERGDTAMKLFRDFAEIGVSLTLDDFGTGYSSISYLTYIPVSKIKIDKSLIDIYLHDGKDSLIKNIIALVHGLGLKITVEGVETKDQYQRLCDFECDYIQGYYFSRPISGDDIEKMAEKKTQK